jgi:Flp pilus assembly protein TadB
VATALCLLMEAHAFLTILSCSLVGFETSEKMRFGQSTSALTKVADDAVPRSCQKRVDCFRDKMPRFDHQRNVANNTNVTSARQHKVQYAMLLCILVYVARTTTPPLRHQRSLPLILPTMLRVAPFAPPLTTRFWKKSLGHYY